MHRVCGPILQCNLMVGSFCTARAVEGLHVCLVKLPVLTQAAYYRAKLRVVAAGGDGTVAWILGTIAELGLNPPPPVAVRLSNIRHLRWS